MTRRHRNRNEGLQRAAEFTLTTLFWLAWLYLVMPLLSLLLWLAGIQFFVDVMITHGGLEALVEDLFRYSLVMMGMLVVTLLWVSWNLRHYGGHNKRTHASQPVSLPELAAGSGLRVTDIAELQSARFVRMTFNADDQPVLRAGKGKG